jgi:hypothetical protein
VYTKPTVLLELHSTEGKLVEGTKLTLLAFTVVENDGPFIYSTLLSMKLEIIIVVDVISPKSHTKFISNHLELSGWLYLQAVKPVGLNSVTTTSQSGSLVCVGVTVGVNVGSGVLFGVVVLLGVGVFVIVSLGVGVLVVVTLGVGVLVTVSVGVKVGVGVFVGVSVCERPGVTVDVEVGVWVFTSVLVGVLVSVLVGVFVGVSVNVGV